MEADFVAVAKIGDLEPGTMKLVEVTSRKISIANVDGSIHAFDDLCTHQHCSLSEGELDGAAVECPCHGSRFDVATGEVLNPPAKEPIKTYQVQIDGDTIAVKV